MSFRIKNISVVFLLAIFVILQSIYLSFPADMWWDAAVYLGMGKHIFSLGNAGLWEPSRPLVWPFLLGLLWKSGANPILFGNIIAIGLSASSILLAYLISKNFFDETTSFIAAVFLAFSPTFFLFTSVLQTEIPSLFFLLLGTHLFLKKKFIISGFSFGTAFMARFFAIFAIIPFFIHLAMLSVKQKNNKKLTIFALFFLIPLAAYLILNQILYSNMLYPFTLQFLMTQTTGAIFNQPFSFYFIGMVKENMLVIFSIPGAYYLLQKKHKRAIFVLSMLVFSFAPFALAQHKEMRLLILSMPFIYMLTAYGIISFVEANKWEKKTVISSLIIIWLIISMPNLKFNQYINNLDFLHKYLKEKDQNGEIWTSNPAYAVYSDKKIDELIYYPTFNHDKFLHLKNNMNKANNIFLNTCDLYCEPYNNYCENDKKEFVALLKNNFKELHYQEEGKCKYFIFAK